MPVPKQRHTKSRRNRRRSHQALSSPVVSLCPKCQSPIRPHHLCHNCGYYNGRQVIDVMAKLTKKEKKKKEKELAAQAKEQDQNKSLNMANLSNK